MLPGQRAEIRIDAYPDLKLNGHVESLGAGTGSEFAILPAQNANGNWVKVTQRVPVRIAIDERSPRPLLAGLSATSTVFTDDRNASDRDPKGEKMASAAGPAQAPSKPQRASGAVEIGRAHV